MRFLFSFFSPPHRFYVSLPPRRKDEDTQRSNFNRKIVNRKIVNITMILFLLPPSPLVPCSSSPPSLPPSLPSFPFSPFFSFLETSHTARPCNPMNLSVSHTDPSRFNHGTYPPNSASFECSNHKGSTLSSSSSLYCSANCLKSTIILTYLMVNIICSYFV